MKMRLFKNALWVALLFATQLAHAGFTVGATNGAFGGATSQAVTLSIPSGDTGVCWIFYNTFSNGGTFSTVTDSSGTNTWTIATTVNNSLAGGTVWMGTAYSVNLSASITTITVHTSGSTGGGGYTGLFCADISATGGTIAFATSGSGYYQANTTTGTDAITTGSLTITSGNGLLFGGGNDIGGGTLSAGTGFTTVSTSEGPVEYKTITSSNAVTYTDNTVNSTAMIAGLALQLNPAGVTNGVMMSNGHPVKSGTSLLYR